MIWRLLKTIANLIIPSGPFITLPETLTTRQVTTRFMGSRYQDRKAATK